MAEHPGVRERAQQAIRDESLGQAVRLTTDRLATGRVAALGAMEDSVAARARARAARQQAVADLSGSIDRFQRAAEAAGVTVHRAVDAQAAVATIRALLQDANARHIVKSKSMATEEIGLRSALEEDGLEVIETDLGEWIVQLAGDPPSHLIVPAVHLNRERIRSLLSRVAGRDLGSETRALAAFARAHLRQAFLRADAGISGANLLVAETGTLVIVSNEGNVRMCTTVPRLHIAVVGMEKVVSTWADALDVLAVLPRSATGQALTTYVSLLSGPRAAADVDGPEAMHVVLLDNGRSRLVGTPAEELLYCIRCGACLNVCPVYRTMGGHAYGSVYGGPIGAALTAHLTEGAVGRDLPWASSLCGACREVCPVGIRLDDQLIALRGLYPREDPVSVQTRRGIAGFSALASHPRRFSTSLRVARLFLGRRRIQRLPGPLARWTHTRSLRPVASVSVAVPRLQPLSDTTAPPSHPVEHSAPHPTIDPVATFMTRWEAVGGHVLQLHPAELPGKITELVGSASAVADPAWVPLVEGNLVDPEVAEVGVVGVAAVAAETATLVLTSGEGRARRASLLPTRVLFVIPEALVYPNLRAAFGALGQLEGNHPPTAVTLVSGPSRSSDIENDQTIGVHGPGDVWALVLSDGARGEKV